MPHVIRLLMAVVYLTTLTPSCDKSAEPAKAETTKPAAGEADRSAKADAKKPVEAEAKQLAAGEPKKPADSAAKKPAEAGATKPAEVAATKPAEPKAKAPTEAEAKPPAKPAKVAEKPKPRPSVVNAAIGPWVTTLAPKRRTKRRKIDKAIVSSLQEVAGPNHKLRFVYPLGKDRFAASFGETYIAFRVEGDRVIDASRTTADLSYGEGQFVSTRIRLKDKDLDGDGVEDWGLSGLRPDPNEELDVFQAVVFLTAGPSVVTLNWGKLGMIDEKGNGEHLLHRPIDVCFGTFDGRRAVVAIHKESSEPHEEASLDDLKSFTKHVYTGQVQVQGSGGDFVDTRLYGQAVAHGDRLKDAKRAWRELNAAPKASPTAPTRVTTELAVLVVRRCAGNALIFPAHQANPLPGVTSLSKPSGWYVLSGISPDKANAGVGAKIPSPASIGRGTALDANVAFPEPYVAKPLPPSQPAGADKEPSDYPKAPTPPVFKPSKPPLATSSDPALKAITSFDDGEVRTPKLKRTKGLIEALDALGKPLHPDPLEIVWVRTVGHGFGAAWRTVEAKGRVYVFAAVYPKDGGFAVAHAVKSSRTGFAGDVGSFISIDDDNMTESAVWIRQKRDTGYRLGLLLFTSALPGVELLFWGARDTRSDGTSVFHDVRLFCGQTVSGKPTVLLRSQRYATPEGGKQTTEANLFKAWAQEPDGTWKTVSKLHGTIVAHSKSYKALLNQLWKVEGLERGSWGDSWIQEDTGDKADFQSCFVWHPEHHRRAAFIAPSFMVDAAGGEKLEKWVIVSGFGHSAEDAKKLAPTLPQPEAKKVVNGTIAVTFPSAKTLWKEGP